VKSSINVEGDTLANIKSSEKSIRKIAKRHAKNVAEKSAVKTHAKNVLKAIESKESAGPEAVTKSYTTYSSKLDRAANHGIMHWKTAARKKSRMAKKVNAATANK
jgi:small subunit ribosomal protein S20